MSADYLLILDHIKAGERDAAHHAVQNLKDPLTCRIHAFLHRQEGDLDNADYWYGRANMRASGMSLSQELEALYAEVRKIP